MPKYTKYLAEFIRYYKRGACDYMFGQSLQDVIRIIGDYQLEKIILLFLVIFTFIIVTIFNLLSYLYVNLNS